MATVGIVNSPRSTIDQQMATVSPLRGSFIAEAFESTTSKAALRTFEWLFATVIAALPLMQLGARLQLGTLTAADLLFIGALAAGGVAAASGTLAIKPSRLYGWIVLYLAVAAVSTAWSDSPSRSTARLPIEIYLALLAVTSMHAVSSKRVLKRLVLSWLLGTALTVTAGLLGVVLFYGGYQPAWRSILIDSYGSLAPGYYPRVHGLFLNMNMCCNYLICSFVFLLISRKMGWIKDGVFAFLMAGICATAAFTVSPGLGGVLLAAGLWIWRECRGVLGRTALVAGVTGACAFLVACVIPPVRGGLPEWRLLVINQSVEASPRVLCWGAAYQMWMAHPLLGKGTGLEVSCPVYRTASGETQHLLDAHSVYLNTLATKGAVGLCALLSIFIVAMYPPRDLRIPPDHEASMIYGALSIAVLCAFLYGGLSGSFEHTRHLWVLLGLLTGTRELASRKAHLGLGEGSTEGTLLGHCSGSAAATVGVPKGVAEYQVPFRPE